MKSNAEEHRSLFEVIATRSDLSHARCDRTLQREDPCGTSPSCRLVRP